jgi:hypothetical protein
MVPGGRQTMLSTVRKKALQTATLKTVRAMRSVFWGSYDRKSSSGSLPILLTLTMALLSPLNAVEAAYPAHNDPEDLTDATNPRKGLYAHRCQGSRT